MDRSDFDNVFCFLKVALEVRPLLATFACALFHCERGVQSTVGGVSYSKHYSSCSWCVGHAPRPFIFHQSLIHF